tara:strand:+ start:1084 stop:2925 length:1842 start_codon:yes stop_codon:yes gene_type:complete
VVTEAVRERAREERLADSLPARNDAYRALHLPYVECQKLDMDPWRKPGGTLRLWDKQREALWHVQQAEGGLVCLPVGAGKGFVGLLAGAVLDVDLVLYLCPPVTLSQMNQYLVLVDNNFRIPRTQLLSYGKLSGASGEKALRELIGDTPDDRLLIVADEAHLLKNRTAARTKRFVRWFKEFPQTRLVAMSGTMTTRSLDDFAHLAELALRGKSPLPRVRRQLQGWCKMLDVPKDFAPSGQPTRAIRPELWMSMLPVWSKLHAGLPIQIEEDARRSMLRQAFAHRLDNTAGVAIQHEGSVGASLLFDALDTGTLPDTVREAIASLGDVTTSPDGQTAKVGNGVGVDTGRLLPDVAIPLERWRLAHQLAKGFYQRWVWPTGSPDEEWLTKRREWGRAVNAELRDHAAQGYDSPMLVAARISREALLGQGEPKHLAWTAWAAVKGRPLPATEVVWLSDFMLRAVRAWVRDNAKRGPLLIWYSDVAVADKLAAAGFKVLRGGDDVLRYVESADVLCLSAHAHAVGLNLQRFNRQLLLGWAGGAKGIEQLLGRTHRAGQLSDEVWATMPLWTTALIEAWGKLLRDARYMQDTTGGQQKVLYAVYTGGAAVHRPEIVQH